MGFFSYDCKHCNHPLLCPQAATEGINTWMTNGVAIMPDGSLLRGKYDGYGRLNDHELHDNKPQIYHRACWAKAGSPTDYTGASPSADDQGWFFDDGAHNLREEDIP